MEYITIDYFCHTFIQFYHSLSAAHAGSCSHQKNLEQQADEKNLTNIWNLNSHHQIAGYSIHASLEYCMY